jgi:low temperature requirement protein LtrA
MHTFIAPLRVRSTGEAGRKVTWLELFFDLIFVAAVAQVAEPLRDHYSVIGLVRFIPLFALIWWAWTGHTVFSTRFDTDDVIQRGLTLVQMFAVAAMAANAKDALDSCSSAGFAAAYASPGTPGRACVPHRRGAVEDCSTCPCHQSTGLPLTRIRVWTPEA